MTSLRRFPLIVSLLLLLGTAACRSSKEQASSVRKESESKPEKEISKEERPSSKEKKLADKYATMLGVSPEQVDHIALYKFIDDWYGVPYKYGGKNKNGIDCSNFTSTLYADVYNVKVSGSSSGIYQQCEQVSKSKLKEGDLVFFKIDQDKISHIGIYLMNNKFVHATTKKGVMIDDLDEAYYKKYFYKAGRLKQ
jgi:lipoprotein Spr